jgi:hypothetical protein
MSSLHVTESCGQTVKRRGENLPTASVRQIFNYLLSGLKLLLYTVTFEYINYCIVQKDVAYYLFMDMHVQIQKVANIPIIIVVYYDFTTLFLPIDMLHDSYES